jgi:hypothetical protein
MRLFNNSAFKQTVLTIMMTLIVVLMFAVVPLANVSAQKSTTGNSSTAGGDRVQDGLNSISDAFPDTVVNKDTTLSETAKKIIDVALYVAAIIAVIFIIYGGYRYIFSAGSEEGAKAGRQTLFNALIGLAIIVLSYIIVQVVYKFLVNQT